MRSGPMSVTFTGLFASGATRRYSSSGTLRVSCRRCLTGRIGNFPAAERRAARAAALLRADALAAAAVVAAYRKPEAVLEIEPADLAVGDDIEARAFLQLEIFPDAIELQPGEGFAVHQPAVEAQARLLPARRAQQAADDVGARGGQAAHCTFPPSSFTAAA